MCLPSPPKPSGPSAEQIARQEAIQKAQLEDIERKESELKAEEERRGKRLENARLGYASLFTSGAGGGGFVAEDAEKRKTLGG